MPSRAILTIVLAAFAGALTGCGAEETGRSDQTIPAREPVRQTARQETQARAGETTGTAAPEWCYVQEGTEGEERRIGDFGPPEDVPPYEVIEERPVDDDCIEAVRLLVDTRAGDKAGYTLIARDIKAKYAGLDAVTVQFTDTSGSLSYEGSALIFNTPSGSYFMGYTAYGPPNGEGYYIAVAE